MSIYTRSLYSHFNRLGPKALGHLLDENKMSGIDGLCGVETKVTEDTIIDIRQKLEQHSYRVS